MSFFPAIAPNQIEYTLPDRPNTVEEFPGAPPVVFDHALGSVGAVGALVTLDYLDRSAEEFIALRDFWINSKGNTVRFRMPAVIWAAQTVPDQITPSTSLWAFEGIPDEVDDGGETITWRATVRQVRR